MEIPTISMRGKHVTLGVTQYTPSHHLVVLVPVWMIKVASEA